MPTDPPIAAAATRTAVGRALQILERRDLRWLVFGLLLLDTLSLKLDGGEEQYFAFAKAFVDPGWIPGSLSLKDVPGSRIVTELLIGHLLDLLSFEQLAVAGRALCALLLAFPLVRLVRQLGLSNLQGLAIVQFIALLSHQSFFAKEWMIGAFESKVIAYALIFWSIAMRLERRDAASVACAAAAAWFHVLVGGWYGIALFAHLLLAREPLRRTVTLAVLYAAMLAPTALYLATHYLSNNPNVIGGLVISRLYVYERNPHHLDLLSQLRYPGSLAQVGLLLSLLSAALCARMLARSGDAALRSLSLLALVLFAQQFAGLAIAFFDADGVFLKYYPYRTSSLSLLIMLLIAARLAAVPALREALPAAWRSGGGTAATHVRRGPALLAGGLVLALAYKVGVNAMDTWRVLRPPPAEAARLAMYAWIRDHTARDAVVLELTAREHLDFIRRTERESYAVGKFVPTTNRLLHDWYLRVQDRGRAMADPRQTAALARDRRIDYALAEAPLAAETLKLVHQEAGQYLYRVQPVAP